MGCGVYVGEVMVECLICFVLFLKKTSFCVRMDSLLSTMLLFKINILFFTGLLRMILKKL